MSSFQESQMISEFLNKFIVPNFYRKDHFYAMNGWSDEKFQAFKKYMEYRISSDDSVAEIVNSLIEDFEEEIEDPNSKYAEDEEDDYQPNICDECNKEVCNGMIGCYGEQMLCHDCLNEKDDSDDEDDTEKFCECSFPKFIIRDGYQSCRNCGLLDHYKCGVVADWSDDEITITKAEFDAEINSAYREGKKDGIRQMEAELEAVEDSDEEVEGVCYECGKEGKFIGKEGDDWECEECNIIN